MAQILDGNATATRIRAEIKSDVQKMVGRDLGGGYVERTGHPPCLAVILCTDDPASQIYVRKKQEACTEVGINSFLIKPFEGGIHNWMSPIGHLLSTIKWLNEDNSVHGILVQLPLPKEINPTLVFDRINPLKDVDVFSPENVGLLLQGRPRFVPCTPQGVQQLLTRNGIKIAGKQVAIINRSDIVGKPLSALLIQDHGEANATVVTCHDQTPPERLKRVCLSSEIIVVAVGQPGFLTADMVPEGAVVVDVGINRLEDKRIVGDADFEAVSKKASWISPVPGGVGPMTVTMLLKNTLQAKRYQ